MRAQIQLTRKASSLLHKLSLELEKDGRSLFGIVCGEPTAGDWHEGLELIFNPGLPVATQRAIVEMLREADSSQI